MPRKINEKLSLSGLSWGIKNKMMVGLLLFSVWTDKSGVH